MKAIKQQAKMAVFQTGIPSGFQSELLKNTDGIHGLSWEFETVGANH